MELPIRQLHSIFQKNPFDYSTIFKKTLDNLFPLGYNSKAVSKNAAIAQSVERILGKDEVASSNLASSSTKPVIPTGMAVFLYYGLTGNLKCV